MKATGIVRRIDELGRVVIPKEIRRTQRIRRGDPLEIFTTGDGEVIFKKYSPIGEMNAVAAQYTEVLSKIFALTNEYRRGAFPVGRHPRRHFLVYVASVLFYEPIFTQPLSFGLCAAGTVEKFATDGAVSVVYLRDSISISKINAAFLTGQQIDRIHVQQLPLPSFMCQGAQRLLLYHVPSQKTIAFLTKNTRKNFPH